MKEMTAHPCNTPASLVVPSGLPSGQHNPRSALEVPASREAAQKLLSPPVAKAVGSGQRRSTRKSAKASCSIFVIYYTFVLEFDEVRVSTCVSGKGRGAMTVIGCSFIELSLLDE
jgi:hypothetical protein